MMDRRIPNNSFVKMDGSGRGVVKSSKYENEEFAYEVEIEGKSLSIQFSRYRTEQLPPAPQMITSRFQSVDETDIYQFIHDQENRNTLKKTYGDMNLLKSFLGTQIENRVIESIPPSDFIITYCVNISWVYESQMVKFMNRIHSFL